MSDEPKRTTSITGTAGEHFVAARLAGMGYVVGLTRGGSPSTDILVSSQDGCSALAIQVKTSSWAWRQRKKKPDESFWEWPVGWKATTVEGSHLWYAFVDLKGWPESDGVPEVFLVPSSVVAEDIRYARKNEWSRPMFYIKVTNVEKYKEKWENLTAALGHK